MANLRTRTSACVVQVAPPEDDIALTTFTADDGVGGVDRYLASEGWNQAR